MTNGLRSSNRRKRVPAKAIVIIVAVSLLFGAAFSIFSGIVEKRMFPRKYSELVEKYAAEYAVPETVVYAVIRAESSFEQYAISPSTPPALGLMQLTEETYEWVGEILLRENVSHADIYDPEVNIKYGTYLLSYLYRRFESWDTVYAAYNAGMNKVSGWLEDPEYSDGNGNLTYIPFPETRTYVKRVAQYRKMYEKLYYN